MRNKYLLCICFFLSGIVLLQSCDKDDDNPQVGIILKDPTNDWRKALRYYAENKLNERNVTYTFTGMSTDRTQGDILKSMVELKGCRVIIISPDNITAEEIAVATSRNIPVIFLEERVGNDYAAIVRSDNYKVGEIAANYLNSLQLTDSIGILFKISGDSIISLSRTEGFYYNIVTPKIKGFEGSAYSYSLGKAFGMEVLENYPDIEAIYAQDDEVALGFLEALDEEDNDKKKEKIKAIIGGGGSQLFLSQIINRKDSITKLATTYYTPAMMETCVDLAIELLNGNQIEREHDFDTEIIDITNAESFINLYLPY